MDRQVPQYQFPEFYHESYLVLLVRDPHCIYAYWEICPELKTILKQKLEKKRQEHLHLRVFDLTGLEHKTGNLPVYCDITLDPKADNYFIKDLEANRWYRAELGLPLEDGSFLTLLSSGTVHTPRNSIAENQTLTVKQACLCQEGEEKDLLIGSFANHGIYGDSIG